MRERIFAFYTRLHGKLSGYYPVFPTPKKEVLLPEISALLGAPLEAIERSWAEYSDWVRSLDYPGKYGGPWEVKHLSTEEAFIIYSLCKRYPVGSIVEIGTQFGKSTRRLIDIKKRLGLDIPVHTYDIHDVVKYFTKDEATLHVKDLTHSFKQDVLDALPPGLLNVDVHVYALLENVFRQVIEDGRWIVAIHDCGMGLYNPHMPFRHSHTEFITSTSGVWMRHVLAKVFNVGQDKLADCAKNGYRLRIFSTQHGLGVLVPSRLVTPATK